MSDEHPKSTVYEREKLYEEVWAEPVQAVAARYGVSGVALAKTCRRLAVPLPGRGYWARLKAGSAPEQPPLGKLPPGKQERIEVFSWYATRAGVPMVAPKDQKPGSERLKVSVPDDLRKPHPLVAQARELLRGPGPL